MGKRDFKQRETKKPKKDARKLSTPSIILPPPPIVEVIRRGKKTREDEEFS